MSLTSKSIRGACGLLSQNDRLKRRDPKTRPGLANFTKFRRDLDKDHFFSLLRTSKGARTTLEISSAIFLNLPPIRVS